MGAKESAVTKSSGQQEKDMTMPDAAFFQLLDSKEKISNQEANYQDERKENQRLDVILFFIINYYNSIIFRIFLIFFSLSRRHLQSDM